MSSFYTVFFDMARDSLPIISLSLYVSGIATLIATFFAIPFGVWLAVYPHKHHALWIGFLNGFTGLPPVVLGLCMYIILSHSGLFGFWQILYTPTAMILTQTILVFPIISAGVRIIAEKHYRATHTYYKMLAMKRSRVVVSVIYDSRYWFFSAIMAGLGRALSEVGAMLIVGGNIKGYTRIMTTTISLETGKGNVALSLVLGGVLLCLILSINIAVALLHNRLFKKYKGMI